MSRFVPSKASVSAPITLRDATLQNLRYMRSAIDTIEALLLKTHKDPPRFVAAKISLAARELGSSVTYMRQMQSSEKP